MVLRTTRITVETETLTIFRRAKASLAWCPGCHAEVDVIALPTTTPADPETAPQMQQWIKHVHLSYSPDGTLQICVPSLLQSSA